MGTPHARARLGRQHADWGMTIIELVLALSLMSAVIVGALGLVRTASLAAQIHGDRLDAQQALRRAMERITEELRWAESVVADPGCAPAGLCPDRVTVHIPAGNPYRQSQAYDVVFQHNTRQREVERRVGRGVNNLAALIDGVAVTYLGADGLPAATPAAVTRVGIALTARPRSGPPLAIQSEVALRNFRAPWPGPPAASGWRPLPHEFERPTSSESVTSFPLHGPPEPR